ncbi:hypothetical protein ACSLVQ_29425, partial [Klebsiella pneumoniae]|uniref:hypothetical protein n=1 Tax=Klebsiella pneumoniae TaxID=573 RepID=UPI003EDED4B5
VTINATGIASNSAFGTNILRNLNRVLPTGIGSAFASGSQTLIPGGVTFILSGIPNSSAYGVDTLTPGVATIRPTGTASVAAYGS